MRIKIYSCCVIVFIVLGIFGCDDDDSKAPTGPGSWYQILINGRLVEGFGMGVDDALRNRNWISQTSESLRFAYPGGLDWGAVFITVGGDPVDPPRPSQNFSQYSRIEIEMKGRTGGECVRIGIKDTNDPDDGLETTIEQQLTTEWTTYPFSLANFATCQMNRVYVVTEFVFPCAGQNNAQTIEVKSITFK